MKITYFINQYPKVSHTFIRREILALEKQGFEIQRVALRGWDADVADETDKKEQQITRFILDKGVKGLLPFAWSRFKAAPIRFLNLMGKAYHLSRMSERNVFVHLVYLLEACKLVAYCKEENSQHIHAHFGTNSTEVAMFASLLSGINYSFTVHGPEEFDKPLGLHLNEKIKHAVFVCAISSFGRSQLYRWADYQDWPKIKIVHCGLDSSFLTGLPARIPNNDVKQLLCIGRLCEQKGQLLLLQAIKKVIDSGHQLKIVLAGDGEMRPDIEQFIQQNALSDVVTITGWISSEQVKQYLLASDAMVLPSFAEGLPVAIMEAMAVGTPVITTYIAGIPELISSGHNGLLAPAGDPDATAGNIETFIKMSETEIATMARLAYNSVEERHNIQTEAEKLGGYIKGAQHE
jgi:colanic acid/amylovoran biosynthesis glycosyltransferase